MSLNESQYDVNIFLLQQLKKGFISYNVRSNLLRSLKYYFFQYAIVGNTLPYLYYRINNEPLWKVLVVRILASNLFLWFILQKYNILIQYNSIMMTLWQIQLIIQLYYQLCSTPPYMLYRPAYIAMDWLGLQLSPLPVEGSETFFMRRLHGNRWFDLSWTGLWLCWNV